VVGKRVGPRRNDPLSWAELDRADAVYFTAGDADAVRAARAARKLIATIRAAEPLAEAGVELDALVSSANDEGERYAPGDLDPPPLLVVRTDGAGGGSLVDADGRSSHWAAAPLPGPAVDAYGAGDSFAGCLTFALAEGRSPGDAVALAARCGAASGAYEGQLRSPASEP
jgi:ribokinase